MGYSSNLSFVRKNPYTTGVATIALAAAGVFIVFRAPISGVAPSATVPVFRLETGSGAQSGICYEDGNCRFSGSIVANGITLGGGTVTFSNAENIYVNQKGDTMTGTLVINTTTAAIGLDNKKASWVQTLHVTGATVLLGTVTIDTSNAVSFDAKEAVWAQTLRSSGAIVSRGTLTMTNGAGISLTGALVSATGSYRRYLTFPLTGSGVLSATGTNVFGDYEIEYPGRIVAAYATLSTAADNKLTTVNALIGGTTIFTTQATIDATEKTSRNAAAPPVINTSQNTLSAGSVITFNVLAPSTNPGRDLKMTLVIDATNFP